MFVMIVGGGRTGSHLSTLLIAQGHEVRLVESRPDTLSSLHRELPTEMIFEGDGTDPQVLETAGIQKAQVLAAVTANDADNIVVCSLAREVYGVRRIIGRINNPKNAWLFTPSMGVDVALNHADLMARMIEEEMSLGDMMTMLKLRRGKFSLVEEKIWPGAKAVGVAIKDLPLSPNCTISGIIRHGEMILPRGVTTLQAEDEVLALVDDAAAEELARLLGRPGDFK
ncbi:MAG: TrkA family potassium uptake protein [Chloroflexi bacterium]|nr:TrkA family potassium uptake protein [Chloroflexota bacterium]